MGQNKAWLWCHIKELNCSSMVVAKNEGHLGKMDHVEPQPKYPFKIGLVTLHLAFFI